MNIVIILCLITGSIAKKISNFQRYNNFIKSRNNDTIIYYSWLVAVCRELVNGSRRYSIEIKN